MFLCTINTLTSYMYTRDIRAGGLSAVKSAVDYACKRAGATLERVVVGWPYDAEQVVAGVLTALGKYETAHNHHDSSSRSSRGRRRGRVKFCVFDHITVRLLHALWAAVWACVCACVSRT